MYIYLLRHAIAEERDEKKYPDDAKRPLTSEGATRMQKAARGFVHLVPAPELILTSPFVRASQTAQILAKSYKIRPPLDTSELLRPGTAAVDIRAMLAKLKKEEHVVLVGHDPGLNELAAFLLDARSPCFALKKSGACAIEFSHRNSFQHGTLLWLASPKMLRQLA